MAPVFCIKNNILCVTISSLGAELTSVIALESNEEFIWQAGEAWPRHAPNLFPIVGSLIDHEYTYQGEKYALSHHGFARDLEFDMLQQSEHAISLILTSSEKTLALFPFKFSLIIAFELFGNTLTQRFRIINDDDITIPVSFGGHPAFNASPIDEYTIEFNLDEDIPSNRLEGPYINHQLLDVIVDKRIALNETIFNHDALIFQNLQSEFVSLKHNKSNHCIKVKIVDWPYLGIWSKPAAPFVCIEPWQGLADFVGHDKTIENKKGMLWLNRKQELSKSFSMQFTAH